MRNGYLYQKVASDLREQIKSGELVPGERLPSIPQLRARYKISHITAIHAFNCLFNAGLITKKNGCGYYVLSKTFAHWNPTVGCIMRGISALRYNQYFNDILSAVQKGLGEYSVDMMFMRLPYEEFPLRFLHTREVCTAAAKMNTMTSALLVDGWVSDEVLGEIMKYYHHPIVVLDRESDLPVYSVANDLKSGYEQVFHTIKYLGYTNLIFFDTGIPDYTSVKMKELFLDLTQKYHFGASQQAVISDCDVIAFDETFVRFFGKYRKLRMTGKTAVLFPSMSCVYFIEELKKHGVELRRDYGLVVWYGTSQMEKYQLNLTSLQPDLREIGSRAVQMLLTELRGKTMPIKAQLVAPNLFLGESL